MSVFGSIMSKIFGHPAAAATSPTVAGAAATPVSGSTPAMGQTTSGAMQGAASGPQVDVGEVLANMASSAGQPLNYKTSIVDLMKLLGLDSSLENRKSLATELHYTGDMNDSASMNVWLHKQVMTKLAENGGVVPADLKG